jgi:hypothetical protein
MDEPAESLPPSAAKLSKTPSWVMLGFLLGALFMWSLPRPPAAAPAPPMAVEIKAVVPSSPPPPPRLMAIEAMFAQWGKLAVWENDVTEVALWTPETKKFSDYFEVIRSGENLYFRSIPRLTRPILTHGVKQNLPLQFTETEAQREDWLRDVQNAARRPKYDQGVLVPSMDQAPRVEKGQDLPVSPPPAEVGPTAPAPRTGTGDGKP